MLSLALNIDASQVDPEKMQGVNDYDNSVVDHIGKANANQEESKNVTHVSAYVVIEEKKEDAKDIDG